MRRRRAQRPGLSEQTTQKEKGLQRKNVGEARPLLDNYKGKSTVNSRLRGAEGGELNTPDSNMAKNCPRVGFNNELSMRIRRTRVGGSRNR